MSSQPCGYYYEDCGWSKLDTRFPPKCLNSCPETWSPRPYSSRLRPRRDGSRFNIRGTRVACPLREWSVDQATAKNCVLGILITAYVSKFELSALIKALQGLCTRGNFPVDSRGAGDQFRIALEVSKRDSADKAQLNSNHGGFQGPNE